MAKTKGYLCNAGFKKATTWPTPVVIGAGDGFQIKSESLEKTVELLEDDAINGRLVPYPGVAGKQTAGGSFDCVWTYDGLDVLIAMTLGTAGAPVQQASTLAYKHTWKVKDDQEGLFGTLGLYKTFEVWEGANAKPKSVEFTIDAGANGSASFEMDAYTFNQNIGSGTNKLSTWGSVALPTNAAIPKIVTFSQMSMYMNTQGGAAPVGGDLIYISKFAVKFARAQEGDLTTLYGTYIEEPTPTANATVEGSFDVPSYGSEHAGLVSALASKAEQKVKVVCTGPVCDGAYNYSFTIYLNNVQLSTGTPNVKDRGKVPLSVAFTAHSASAAPTGWPAAGTEAMILEVINKRNTDALA